MIIFWYLLGFVCGAFFYYALSLFRGAKRRREGVESDEALKNILNY